MSDGYYIGNGPPITTVSELIKQLQDILDDQGNHITKIRLPEMVFAWTPANIKKTGLYKKPPRMAID